MQLTRPTSPPAGEFSSSIFGTIATAERLARSEKPPNPKAPSGFSTRNLARARPRTYVGYESLLRLNAIPSIGEIPLTALRPLDLQHLYATLLTPDRGLAAGTVLNLHLVLTNALGQAERWGLGERARWTARWKMWRSLRP